MMNNPNYLICEMENNAFTVHAGAVIDNVYYQFPIKIDTGCTYSVLPYRVIANVRLRQSRRIKAKDLSKHLPIKRSYGVSDTEFRKHIDKILLKMNMGIRCKSLKFLHKDTTISLNGFSFRSDIYVNYDRTCNPLLGLDILKTFVFMCDVSKITGRYTFIGCPIFQDNKTDFYEALLKHFGVTEYTIG